jgi:hypothetical protein
MTTTNNNIQRLQNKLTAIATAITAYDGDNGIYARRKVLKLNELANKAELQLKELTK